ncbi:MAG: hypothetical protein J6V25_12690 [Oscillospiraceae bacterium]|nr:hypothetical protein [Oscillospiraceae bacterium]
MKRHSFLWMGGCILILTILLMSRKVNDPADFGGVWYDVRTGTAYVFDGGLILGPKESGIHLNGEEFCGAYCYAGNQVTLFLVQNNSTGQQLQLTLKHHWQGDSLCTENEEVLLSRILPE